MNRMAQVGSAGNSLEGHVLVSANLQTSLPCPVVLATYECDTLKGDSGAPVYNFFGDFIGVHVGESDVPGHNCFIYAPDLFSCGERLPQPARRG